MIWLSGLAYEQHWLETRPTAVQRALGEERANPTNFGFKPRKNAHATAKGNQTLKVRAMLRRLGL